MITAICEMSDQACGIEAVRIIENTPESIASFEEEMDEMMCMFGYQLYFYNSIIPDTNSNESIVYQWMRDNEQYEIDVDV
ncbi:hypothetical protein FDG95_gp350 [Pectobacterium phage vB_PcaM_CBB]|uniref:Uncharacterized protein n=1 Tax=Pectobacterium phage vB_PcaM_CBB TaxID=2772511 RepID=A0A1L2CV59_9CAUD|nr:hypothetical protein FDG95_gp350 [Pectobacterium phage vB_PcaM_CBB]AMM43913.1 hypothetical protein CBB_350 [Pectobacterium phage vB_PcaM_CBB]